MQINIKHKLCMAKQKKSKESECREKRELIIWNNRMNGNAVVVLVRKVAQTQCAHIGHIRQPTQTFCSLCALNLALKLLKSFSFILSVKEST